jgi:ABC-type transport system substrate-binding protein
MAQEPAATPIASPVVTDSITAPSPGGIDIGGEETSGRPRNGGAVRLVRPGENVANFNPAAFAQDPQIPLSYLEPLVRPDPLTLRPEPWLARRWDWQDALAL